MSMYKYTLRTVTLHEIFMYHIARLGLKLEHCGLIYTNILKESLWPIAIQIYTTKTVVVIKSGGYIRTYSTWFLAGAAHQNMVEIMWFTLKWWLRHPNKVECMYTMKIVSSYNPDTQIAVLKHLEKFSVTAL